ncbi:uncharacterized protein E2C01_039326 [Portunus trituberculatus]|uniref:RNA-directed DNA polymerase n=1 Tax=Portunus trituberculatus TaxID=210409 RepID=A0A5B7FEH0_PORTR|nr:uncharacterized protein [Portunus trituberculatus]
MITRFSVVTPKRRLGGDMGPNMGSTVHVTIPGLPSSHNMHAKIDTGAEGNILLFRCYKMFPPGFSLQKNTRISAYNGSQISHHTSVTMKVQHGSCECMTKSYVVETDSPIILGVPMDSLVVDDGVILKGNTAVIPRPLCAWCIDKLHDSYHGRVKMELCAKDTVYWPEMRNDIKSRVNACQPCQFTRPVNDCAELMPDHQRLVPQEPWQDVSTDLFHYNSHNYILVVDHYCSYVFVYKLLGTTSRDMIEILVRLFAEHGSPTTLYSDNGSQFNSCEFSNFTACLSFGISHPRIYTRRAKAMLNGRCGL